MMIVCHDPECQKASDEYRSLVAVARRLKEYAVALGARNRFRAGPHADARAAWDAADIAPVGSRAAVRATSARVRELEERIAAHAAEAAATATTVTSVALAQQAASSTSAGLRAVSPTIRPGTSKPARPAAVAPAERREHEVVRAEPAAENGAPLAPPLALTAVADNGQQRPAPVSRHRPAPKGTSAAPGGLSLPQRPPLYMRSPPSSSAAKGAVGGLPGRGGGPPPQQAHVNVSKRSVANNENAGVDAAATARARSVERLAGGAKPGGSGSGGAGKRLCLGLPRKRMAPPPALPPR